MLFVRMLQLQSYAQMLTVLQQMREPSPEQYPCWSKRACSWASGPEPSGRLQWLHGCSSCLPGWRPACSTASSPSAGLQVQPCMASPSERAVGIEKPLVVTKQSCTKHPSHSCIPGHLSHERSIKTPCRSYARKYPATFRSPAISTSSTELVQSCEWMPAYLKASPAALYCLARLRSTPSATCTSALPASCKKQCSLMQGLSNAKQPGSRTQQADASPEVSMSPLQCSPRP